jgi:hypothetical protein
MGRREEGVGKKKTSTEMHNVACYKACWVDQELSPFTGHTDLLGCALAVCLHRRGAEEAGQQAAHPSWAINWWCHSVETFSFSALGTIGMLQPGGTRGGGGGVGEEEEEEGVKNKTIEKKETAERRRKEIQQGATFKPTVVSTVNLATTSSAGNLCTSVEYDIVK